MRKIMNVVEVDGEGLMRFIGENVMIFCMSYIYAGKLTGVNDECVLLDDAKIVYETGSFSEQGYADAQSLPGKQVYIMKRNIESFMLGK